MYAIYQSRRTRLDLFEKHALPDGEDVVLCVVVEPALLCLDEHVALVPQARGHRGKLVPQPNLGNNRLGNAV